MTKCLFEITFFLVATARTFPEYISCFCTGRFHYLHFLHLMFFTTYLDIRIRIFGFCCRSNTYLCRLNINRRTSDHRHNKQNCKNSTLFISSHTNFLLCIEIRQNDIFILSLIRFSYIKRVQNGPLSVISFDISQNNSPKQGYLI